MNTAKSDTAIRKDYSNFKASGVFVEQKLPGGQKHARLLLPLVAKGNRQTLKRGSMEDVKPQKKKAGRPTKAFKKEVRACIRYSKAEYFIIRQKASKAGIKPSVYVRQITINGQVKSRLTEEERHFVKQLIGMANNLNQLAKACHEEGALRAMRYFENYRDAIDGLLKQLKNDK